MNLRFPFLVASLLSLTAASAVAQLNLKNPIFEETVDGESKRCSPVLIGWIELYDSSNPRPAGEAPEYYQKQTMTGYRSSFTQYQGSGYTAEYSSTTTFPGTYSQKLPNPTAPTESIEVATTQIDQYDGDVDYPADLAEACGRLPAGGTVTMTAITHGSGNQVLSRTTSADSGICSGGDSGYGYGILSSYHKDTATFSYSDADTEEAARGRAVKTEEKGTTSYWYNRAYGIQQDRWNEQTATVWGQFRVCSGTYILHYRQYEKTLHTGAETSALMQKVVQVKDGKVSVELPFKKGMEYGLKDLDTNIPHKFALEPLTNCQTGCGSGGPSPRGGSGPNPATASVHWYLPLEQDPDGEMTALVRIDEEAIASAYLPSSLQVITSQDFEGETYSDATGFVQSHSPDRVVNRTAIAGGYALSVYKTGSVTLSGTAMPYTIVSGTPEVVWNVYNPSATATNQLNIDKVVGGTTTPFLYTYNSSTDTWTLSEAGGLRVVELDTDLDTVTGNRLVTETIKGADGVPVKVTLYEKKNFIWGESTVRIVRDPAGRNLWEKHFWSDSGNNFGKLYRTERWDGYWEEAEFDSQHRIDSKTSFLGYGAGESEIDYSYDTGSQDYDGDNLSERIEIRRYNQLGRSEFTAEYTKLQTHALGAYRVVYESVAPNLSSSWNAAGNVITRRHVLLEGKYAGRNLYREFSDGTLETFSVAIAGDGSSIESTRRGAESTTTPDTVGSGTESLVYRNADGYVTKREERDIETDAVLSRAEILTDDIWKRPTKIRHLDGFEEEFAYSSCCAKLTLHKDRDGTHDFQYDALGRQWRHDHGGISAETVYDAVHQAVASKRYPFGQAGSAIVTASTKYNLAGEITEQRDGFNRLTTMAVNYNATTQQATETIALPYDAAWATADRGTRIRVFSADGRTVSQGGTASAPSRYVYGSDTLADAAEWGYPVNQLFNFVQQIKLDENGADTPETTTTYSDPLGRTIKVVLGDGAATRFFYNAKGQLSHQIDPTGVRTLYLYNALGQRIISALDLGNPGTAYEVNYDGTDRITRTETVVTTRSGTPVRRTTTKVWTEADDAENEGTVIRTQEVSLDGLQTWQETYGQLTHTLLAYDAATATRTETVTAPDHSQTVRMYVHGRLMTETRKDPAGTAVAETANGYDSHGRLQFTSSLHTPGTTLPLFTNPSFPLSQVTSYTYHNDDQVATIRTPDPDTARSGTGYDAQISAYHYDDAGRVDDVTLPDGTHQYTTYWPTNRIKRSSGSRTYPSDYTYDAQGRMKTLTTWKDFAGTTGAAVTTWNYDSERGWLSGKRYADNKGPDYTYDDAGRLATRTWARALPGTSTRIGTVYSYDPVSKDLTGIDYAGDTPDVSLSDYDRLGRPTEITDGSGTRTLSYRNGRLDDEGYTAGLLAGREITRSPQVSGAPHNPYGVDRLGTLSVTGLTDFTYGYDELGRLETITQGTREATLAYRPLTGALQSVTTSQSGTERLKLSRSTDQIGRIEQVEAYLNAATTTAMTRIYTYNAANQRTQVEHESSRRWSYGYDELGQVDSAQKQQYQGSVWSALPGYGYAFDYDDIGNRKSATVNGRLTNYTSDALNRYQNRETSLFADVRGSAAATAGVLVNDMLTARSGEDFYLAVPVTGLAANTLKVQATTVSPQQVATENRTQLVPAAPENFAYDDDGNLLSDGLWTYEWDAENRLKAQQMRADLAVATWNRLEFAYDNQGRRAQKKVLTRAHPTSGAWTEISDTRFLYDGWNLLAEYAWNASTSTFSLNASHAWGLDLSGTAQGAGGVGGLLWTTVAATAKTYAPSIDANGNVFAYVDCSDGVIAGKRDYGAFGEAVLTTGVAGSLPFGFSTKYEDKESGLYYYGYRFYNPSTGRWLSRDPIEEKGGLNLYEFVLNDPIAKIDALGNSPQGAALIGAIAVISSCALPYHVYALSHYGHRSDKFRHCWVSCKMSRTCGGMITEIAGLGKEVRDRAVAAFCEKYPTSGLCNGGHGDFMDSLADLKANQQCIGWESLVLGPVGGWIGAACRRSCEDCCKAKIGY